MSTDSFSSPYLTRDRTPHERIAIVVVHRCEGDPNLKSAVSQPWQREPHLRYSSWPEPIPTAIPAPVRACERMVLVYEEKTLEAVLRETIYGYACWRASPGVELRESPSAGMWIQLDVSLRARQTFLARDLGVHQGTRCYAVEENTAPDIGRFLVLHMPGYGRSLAMYHASTIRRRFSDRETPSKTDTLEQSLFEYIDPKVQAGFAANASP